MSEHDRLWQITRKLPGDYDPWGEVERWKDSNVAYPDCSGGCRFARWLADMNEETISNDWCVCTNQASHHAGLLTFEHQGCQKFEGEDDAGL